MLQCVDLVLPFQLFYAVFVLCLALVEFVQQAFLLAFLLVLLFEHEDVVVVEVVLHLDHTEDGHDTHDGEGESGQLLILDADDLVVGGVFGGTDRAGVEDH